MRYIYLLICTLVISSCGGGGGHGSGGDDGGVGGGGAGAAEVVESELGPQGGKTRRGESGFGSGLGRISAEANSLRFLSLLRVGEPNKYPSSS